jgi:hypothetical protein
MSKAHIYANQCGFCDEERVETIGVIRLCQRHLDIVNAIAADVKKVRADRVKQSRSAA